MLYDIVSPALFFLSLGGIILITARVVLRIRRQHITADMQADLSEATVTDAPFGTTNMKEMSSLLQPSKKSVRVIGSRLGLVRQHMQHNRQALRQWWQQRREENVVQTASEALPHNTTEEATATSGVVRPLQRLSRLTQTMRELPRRVWHRAVTARRMETTTEVMAKEEAAAPASLVSKPTFSLTRNMQATSSDDATTKVFSSDTPAQPSAVSENGAVPAPTVSAVPRRGRRNLLLRHPHPVEENSPKAKASAALAAGQYQKVEDVMVSYIVKHPKDTEAYMLLGQAALGRKAWTEAMEIFEQVISWNQQEKGAYAGLGTAAYRVGKFTRALQALQRAHDADPRDRAVLEHLLAIAQKLDNHGLLHSLEQEIQKLSVEPTSEENHQVTTH